ncbi:Epoxide hydrolase A [Methylobacterium jeotgali]|uniref:Epoxide hydrolase A n=5 Tax=Pseudomonadota TaxID=1224 RepID=A0ABQ4SYV0_9HYPH|nr:alpha/beta hydrolase [Methylobacterium sp.]GJE07088.1 Epoxide hydrolase A [Methylobacterium jeotgali]
MTARGPRAGGATRWGYPVYDAGTAYMTGIDPVPAAVLPPGIRARLVPDVNGLAFHVLEVGSAGERPSLLLLHGFPELAYSWRRVMVPLAEAGFHVVAPDQRGYGRTSPAPVGYSDDLAPFGILNLVRDMVALASALDIPAFAGVVGHDYGASVAAACALVRPDLFRSLVIMSAPFLGAPAWPLPPPRSSDPINDALAALERPRKHYQAYFATSEANGHMWRDPRGVHDFLRAYFHVKSGDWVGNWPFELGSWAAEELARMPDYYIMPLALGMAETVAPEMPSASAIEACAWLTERELGFYSGEYARTGFQGGLQWYRGRIDGSLARGLSLFSGRTIDCPALFIAGDRDWGARQIPDGIETMRTRAFSRMREPHFVAGAGHWVQQERPEETAAAIIAFLNEPGRDRD